MKKTLKGYILGLLTSALLIGCVSYAANTVRIVVDGQEIIPTDVNGNRVDPVIINGTTYLPVRAVANAFGKEVYWDGPNYTVYLGKMNGTLDYPSATMLDLTNLAGDPLKSNKLTDNYGNSYDYAVGYAWEREWEYILNMKYSKFKGTIYVPQGETSDGLSHISVIADGKTIYTSPEIRKNSAPIQLDLNITGCNDFKIETSPSGYGNMQVNIGNGGFYQ